MNGIEIFRSGMAEDEYGDPQPTTWALLETYAGLFAPSNPSEPLEAGRNTVISGGVVYIRTRGLLSPAPGAIPDIKSSDRARIAGVTYDIDGDVGTWSGFDGVTGIQFAVKSTVKVAS